MAVKILIKRHFKEGKTAEAFALLLKFRRNAMNQPGYISGETMRSLDNPDEFLVISTWESSDDWKNWVKSADRKEVQDKIDALLGGTTDYEIFHYGFTE